MADLNPSQRDAVHTLSGPLLVLAGAGTGKTRVITYRMVELIKSGVPGDRILSVTFTNKAAREMKERLHVLLGKRSGPAPLVSTFHSLCVRILREDAPALGYPTSFAIYDRSDQESAARTALRDIRTPASALTPSDLVNTISRWKSAGVSPARAVDHAENDKDFLAATAFKRYQSILKSCAAVDFDDLLFLTNELFHENEEILDKHRQRFRHVQIDEYQDTNGQQFDLAKALVEQHRNLCVVGDDDQSIYGWRGADVSHILKFPSHFPGTKVVRLQDNYRCTHEIIAVANTLVRHNQERHDKSLIAHKSASESVRFREYPDEAAEAEGVVREIVAQTKIRGVPPGDIAILFRTNEQPRPFEIELRRSKIPYIVLGSMSFFERREIRDVLSYLKAIMNPQDEVSLLRIINVPARGIGETTVQKILDHAVRNKWKFWDSADHFVREGAVTKAAAQGLTLFRDLLTRYRKGFEEAPAQLGDTLRALLDEIGYEAEVEKQYKEAQQQLIHTGMVDEFVETVQHYAKTTPSPTLAGFLDETALTSPMDGREKEQKLSQNGVKLMTLHSAKGLEFPRVYLVGMEEGLLPHKRAVEMEGKAIEEERRLAYVGVTRAKDVLTLTRAAARTKWGRRGPTLPSRFLFEMQEVAPVIAVGEGGTAEESEA